MNKYELDRILDTIEERGAKKIGLQFPEGLRRSALELAKKIEERTDAIVLISGSPCYGACDLDEFLLREVDLLFHFGHAEMKPRDKVAFIEVRSDADVIPVLEQAIKMIKGKRVGLITTVQHVHKLGEARDYLLQHGKDCLIGKGDSRIKYDGQILGCNFSAARIDADEFIYIGSGDFHPLGVTLATSKRVIIADPMSKEVREIDPKPILRQRYAIIAKALSAKTFGILVSTKSAQTRIELARKLQEKALEKGLEAHLISMNEITPELLLFFKVDAFVNTACPRIAIDDAALFKTPMITPIEFEIVLGERDWSQIKFDEMLG
ncbi:MAG: diphthamide biosynthesis enzyme Dph2 [Methanocellales archaeon]|nr:diphthamide biosynthesis enzyme Dph2 [Methanocellales archaeon]MDD3292079.1 diphthamide biosynthesis enzyme Dph2 [Methanocellales archaeon]MDD5235540.1 diphthamide biosynthesis enzyme Dph2 [Methanocellales archaeon]MDD5485564.1 diphthamide biosynthesis enzyme Dph2 [Methanocellales archaeon]